MSRPSVYPTTSMPLQISHQEHIEGFQDTGMVAGHVGCSHGDLRMGFSDDNRH